MSVLCKVSDKGYVCSYVTYQIKGMSALCKVSDKGYVCYFYGIR